LMTPGDAASRGGYGLCSETVTGCGHLI
jgi:hypothetical protein